jgi:glycosyltransferase involved in cell wall biosynthesis
MPSLTLADLPQPPPGKSGWPWTVETSPLPDAQPDGAPWPRISIVTPSYNQGQFIEETIRSILLQGYPNLEYIIVDGGSTDGTVEIIRKYERHLAYWVSEKDRGQSHAISKGMARATGQIRAYLNSDDTYLPGALASVADRATKQPAADLIHGRCRISDENGTKIGERVGSIATFDEIVDLWDVWWNQRNFVQPEVFWTSRIASKVGPFREDLYWVMDFDYWLRILHAGGQVGFIDAELAMFRQQPAQKSTQPERTAAELREVVRPYIFASDALVGRSRRVRLQGKWLFDTVFREQAQRSLDLHESRLRRWGRLAKIALQHPQLVTFAPFRQRVWSALTPAPQK